MSRTISTLRTATAAIALLTAAAPLAAQADVFIGLQEAGYNGGAIFQVLPGDASGFQQFAGSFGTFAINAITVSGPPASANLLDSTALNISSAAPGTLNVYVTSTDLTLSGAQNFQSVLTSNSLPAGWTTNIATYYNAANTVFGTATTLADHLFPTEDTFNNITALNADGLFSVTGLYTLTATGIGTALSTLRVNSSPVPAPEPSTLLILGAALLAGAGVIRRIST